MAFISVVYGDDMESADASQIANKVESISDVDAGTEKVNSISDVDIDAVDGVIVVGGLKANDVYDFMVDRKGWDTPQAPVFDRDSPLFTPDNVMVVTDVTGYQGVLFQGVAGYTEEDTNNLVDAYTGDSAPDFNLNFRT